MSFHFNISKSTPTTSTTNTNMTSQPVSASKSESSVSTNGQLEPLSFLKSQSSSDSTKDHAANPTEEGVHDANKSELRNILEKFHSEQIDTQTDLQREDQKDVISLSKSSVEESHSDFDGDDDGASQSSSLFGRVEKNSVGEPTEDVQVQEQKWDNLEKGNLYKVIQETDQSGVPSSSIDESTENNHTETESGQIQGTIVKSLAPKESQDQGYMTMQPYIMEDFPTDAEKARKQNEIPLKTQEESSREKSPSENNDLLSMENSETIEELQIPETSQKAEITNSAPRPNISRKSSIARASKRIVNASEQYQSSHRPFDFQVFLSHLRNKNADPVVRYIRSFLMSFAKQASTMSPSQMMKAIRNFKEFIENKFHLYEPFASMNNNDVENSVEGVEKLIMNRLYDFCFPPEATKKTPYHLSTAMAADLSEDAEFSTQIEKFSWISGVHLDVDLDDISEKKRLALKENVDYMEYSALELNKINNYRAPRDKIICILNTCKILFNLLRATDQETNADAFIPLLILVILKAKTENLISNLHYIERFRGENWLNHGETSYYLSTMQGAITFIQNIKKEDLTIEQSHFDAHMEAWDAEIRQRKRDRQSETGTESVVNGSSASSSRQIMLPSNVLAASAELLTKSIGNLMSSSDQDLEPRSTASNSQEEPTQSPNSEQIDETFRQLSEIFPSLDKDIMRDIIIMNRAEFETSLEVCLQLNSDD